MYKKKTKPFKYKGLWDNNTSSCRQGKQEHVSREIHGRDFNEHG
jgi:hypothetical protein